MKFKNMQRPTRSKQAVKTPPEKKARLEIPVEDEPSYNHHVEYLQQLYRSKKASLNSIRGVGSNFEVVRPD